jgi:hypothetical protein
VEHIALAGVGGNQIPQMAGLGLADAVDPPEPLLDPVRVSRQVVVDHQVGALKVQPLPRRVSRHQQHALAVLHEQILDAAAVDPVDPATDRPPVRLVAPDQRGSSPPGSAACPDAQ